MLRKRKIPFYIIVVLLLAVTLLCCACEGGRNLRVDTVPLAETALAAVDDEIDELADNYAAYFTPAQYKLMQDDYTGSFGGVGVSMALDDKGEIVVYGIMENTPAASSKIAEGDVILSVDKKSLAGKDPDEAAAMIRGKVGEKVTLELRNSAGKTYQVMLTRATITEKTVEGQNLAGYPGTAYIRISSFRQQTVEDFANIYNQLYADCPIKNLILDLRSNGGGNFYASISIGEYFVPVNEIVVSEKTSAGSEVYRSSNGQLAGLNVVILQNAYTASASEVLIGAIKDMGNAVSVGTTTYGKGITQNIVPVPSGGGHRYTRSIYYTPSGFSLHGIGLTADIPVEDPESATYATYFSMDPAVNTHLKAALTYLYPGDNSEETVEGSGEAKTDDSDKNADADKDKDKNSDKSKEQATDKK